MSPDAVQERPGDAVEVNQVLKLPFRAPGAKGASDAITSQNGLAVRTRPAGRFLKTVRRRWPLALVLLLVLAGGGYVAASRLTAEPTAVAQRTAPVTRGTLVSTVSATGTVAALAQSKLAFSTSGKIVEVLVKQGDAVKKGDPLARLDPADLNLQLTQQKAAASTADAKLANIKTGSKPEDIKAAQLQLDAAKAKLAAMQAGGRPEDVASAQASVASARAKLNQLKNPSEADVKAAEQTVASATSALQTAQNSLDKLKSGATAEDIKAAEFAVDQAKNGLWSQQISRDGTCGRDKDNYQCKAADASVASAETGVTKAQNDLAKLKLPAKPEDITAAENAVASAKAQVDSANLKLKQLKAPSADDITATQAAVTQAEQSLALKQKPYTEADIQAQQQAVASAEAALAAKQVPYTDADIVSAQAAVDQAKAQLAQAQRNVENATLVAPFDGVVGAVGFNVGEASGSATITLVDPKNVRLDVTVDESDIAKIEAKQKATVTFDSIPNKTYQGSVSAVAPSATITSGVATYPISIALPDPSGVRPGMTGNASIVFGEKVDALTVPNRAIRNQGRNKVVDVVVGGEAATPAAGTQRTGGQNSQGGTPNAGANGAQGRQGGAQGTPPTDGGSGGAQIRVGGGQGGASNAGVATTPLKTETRVVQTGLSNDTMTEITSGLSDGEVVVIPATTSSLQTGRGGPGGAPGGAVVVGGPPPGR